MKTRQEYQNKLLFKVKVEKTKEEEIFLPLWFAALSLISRGAKKEKKNFLFYSSNPQ